MQLLTCKIVLIMALLPKCLGGMLDNDLKANSSNVDEIEKIGNELEISVAKVLAETDHFPENCSQREKKKIQHSFNRNARLKKCCPIGEGLCMNKDEQTGAMCVSTSRSLLIVPINVTLYDNCIEDMESEISLPFEIGNPCNTSFLYNDVDDLFYVMQDGSLLVMDPYANDSYSTESKYCIDVENVSGTTYAIVCITAVEEHINRSNIVVVAILMLISIPCLMLVSYVHIRIKDLRSVHGMSLSVMSACLAAGYFLYSLVHIFKMDERDVGYAVQFFILSFYFWFFCLCVNISINIWLYIPLNKEKTKRISFAYVGSFFAISSFGALVLVISTYQKGLPGMPSYFIQGYTESIRESQRFFIPPVSSLLLLSFFIMAATFFGFQKLKNRGISVAYKAPEESSGNYVHNFEEAKKDAKCISLLGIILISTWLLEIVTFYSPGPQIYLILMDMINGLQGVFVLLIFLIMRRRRNIIFRWWNDRGSFAVESIELNT